MALSSHAKQMGVLYRFNQRAEIILFLMIGL
nr:MAG TPA: hypothetical protein [Caudoviricetes sp.]